MICPKCKTDNPDGSEVCRECDRVLVYYGTSKLAVFAFILAVASLVFTIITALPAILIGRAAKKRIRKSNGLLKGNALIKSTNIFASLGLVFFGLGLLWTIDAPPMENDYTVADLKSAAPKFNDSYRVLCLLSDEAIGLKSILSKPLHPGEQTSNQNHSASGNKMRNYEDLLHLTHELLEGDWDQVRQNLKAHSAQIDQLWADTSQVRGLFESLDKYEHIADLADPTHKGPGGARPFDQSNMGLLYVLYSCSQHIKDAESFPADLILSDSVARKTSVNARRSISKFLLLFIVDRDITAANFIINDPKTPDETVIGLSKHFTSLTSEQLSLHHAIIDSYFRNRLRIDRRRDGQSAGKHKLVSLVRVPFFKPNSTLRLMHNYTALSLSISNGGSKEPFEPLSVWPRFLPSIVPEKNLFRIFEDQDYSPRLYRMYNPKGVTDVKGYRWGEDTSVQCTLQIRDDLFQIVIAMRLGKPYSLKARAYGDNYIIDVERRIIYSPGPDLKPLTKDDIKLPINPEVLNLK